MGMFCYSASRRARAAAAPRKGCAARTQRRALQDLLVTPSKASRATRTAGSLKLRDRELDVFVIEALFTTVTNVNFDPQRIEGI